jgi:hypothetical protein
MRLRLAVCMQPLRVRCLEAWPYILLDQSVFFDLPKASSVANHIVHSADADVPQVSGFQTLRNLATRSGEVLSLQYFVSSTRLHGVCISRKKILYSCQQHLGWIHYKTLRPSNACQCSVGDGVVGYIWRGQQ